MITSLKIWRQTLIFKILLKISWLPSWGIIKSISICFCIWCLIFCFELVFVRFKVMPKDLDVLQWWWGLLYQISQFIFFVFNFYYNQPNKSHLFEITFIFGRCHCSLAAVTPVEYECDSTHTTDTFAKAKMSLTEKSTDISHPHPRNAKGRLCT